MVCVSCPKPQNLSRAVDPLIEGTVQGDFKNRSLCGFIRYLHFGGKNVHYPEENIGSLLSKNVVKSTI
jgi:hypothetical protein